MPGYALGMHPSQAEKKKWVAVHTELATEVETEVTAVCNYVTESEQGTEAQ